MCPQFDILWPELTGEEHLYLFSGLKGLDKKEVPSEMQRLLNAVELVDAGNVRSSAYSGGMKRRLSVAIGINYVVFANVPALIGNPKLVYLDEPVST